MLVPRIAMLILAALAGSVSAVAGPVAENEKLVMRLVFEDCLGYVRDDRKPFVGLATKPASAEAIADLPDRMPDRERAVELLSPRYIAAWGEDAESRYCTIMTVFAARKRGEPLLLGVRAPGFVERVTKRAATEGLTGGEHGTEFSPVSLSQWSEPNKDASSGPDRPVSFTMLPSDGADGSDIMDAGLIVMGGPPLPREPRPCADCGSADPAKPAR